MDHVTDTRTAPHQTLDQWSNQWSDTLLDQVSNMFLVPPQSKHDQHEINKNHWSNTLMNPLSDHPFIRYGMSDQGSKE